MSKLWARVECLELCVYLDLFAAYDIAVHLEYGRPYGTRRRQRRQSNVDGVRTFWVE